jgi:leucyl-tRNA synthetase
MLSDCPPERDMDWSDAGIEGSWRYLNRLWRMAGEVAGNNETDLPSAPLPTDGSSDAGKLVRLCHKTIAEVTEDLERLRFNNAVARVRELTNAIHALGQADDSAKTAYRFGMETVIRLLAPMTPHLTEELWAELGNSESILAESPWPTFDPALLIEDTVTLAVQVNGKLRATLDMAKDASKDAIEQAALALPNVQSQIDGKTIRKVVVVPGKIVNVVAN